MSKVTIEMNDKQAGVIIDALDMYSRVGMGQLEIIEEFLRMHFWGKFDKYKVSTIFNETRRQISIIKALVFDHSPNGSWGIFNEEVPQSCREAFDIIQALRKPLAVTRVAELEEEGKDVLANHVRQTVDMGDYMPANPDWPKIKVKVER